MSLSHLLNPNDSYSSILNGGFNTLTANSITVSNFIVANISVVNSFNLSLGINQALTVNTQNNSPSTWIGGKFGCVYQSDKYMVMGNLNGYATIGGNQIDSSGTVIGWSDLIINPIAGGNIYAGGLISNPQKFNVAGNMNISGNYYLNNYNYTSFRRSLSIGGGWVVSPFSSVVTLTNMYIFVFDPQTNGTWVSFEICCLNMSGSRTIDWELYDETNSLSIATYTLQRPSKSVLGYSTSGFTNIPTSAATLTFRVKTESGGENFGNIQLNFT